MPIQLTNNAAATIPGDVSSIATSIVVSTGQGALFPALGAGDYFYATLVSVPGAYEIIKVTARVGDTFTVVRAQEGTVAMAFPPNSRLELRATVANLRGPVDDLNLLLL